MCRVSIHLAWTCLAYCRLQKPAGLNSINNSGLTSVFVWVSVFIGLTFGQIRLVEKSYSIFHSGITIIFRLANILGLNRHRDLENLNLRKTQRISTSYETSYNKCQNYSPIYRYKVDSLYTFTSTAHPLHIMCSDQILSLIRPQFCIFIKGMFRIASSNNLWAST